MADTALQSDTDARLLQECRRGDPSALAVLYDRHASALLRVATRLTGNRAEAEDILHDLFVALPEMLGRYNERGRLEAWLRAVVARIALDRMKRTAARTRSLEAHSASFVTGAATDASVRPDLERAISKLNEGERAVVVLRHFEGYTHVEVAALLGISGGAVRVRYIRALHRLRKLLEQK